MSRQLTRSEIRIYGTLSALGRDSGHILDRLSPFFEPILRQHNGEKLNPDVIASDIREAYNWNFNADLVETFVPHLEKQGWIVSDTQTSQKIRKSKRPIRFQPRKIKADSYTILMKENDNPYASLQNTVHELRKIAVQFKKFAEELSPLPSIPQDIEKYEEILLNWLLYVEALSEESIDARSSFESDLRSDKKVAKSPDTTSLKRAEKYLCARFVRHVIEKGDGTAKLLVKIASVGLLTEVVQDFAKPVEPVKKTTLSVYLDSPIAMELLGLSGELYRENIAPAIDELRKIGASIRIFDQSIKEIEHNLKVVLSEQPPASPTTRAIIRGDVLKEYVIEVSSNPALFLEKHGVQVVHRELDQFPSEHKYFTVDDMLALDSKLNYENILAREHDAAIATLVARERKGKISSDVFKSRAIVLARNYHFVESAREVYFASIGRHNKVVPPVIHRRVLVTALWLRTGMGAERLEIPKRMLLASCERVMALHPGLVDAVRQIIDNLDDKEKGRQLNLLASQTRSADALMDKTLGDVTVVTEENFPELWQEMLDPHLEEVKAEENKKLRKAEEEIASRDAELDTRIREDRVLIEKLCEDIERSLGNRRKARIGAAIIIAFLAIYLPPQFETTPSIRNILHVGGWFFAYLTITGGRMISVNIKEKNALTSLRTEANRRRISPKLDKFHIKWNGKAFIVEDR